ncbi:hypothetical protein SAMN05421630_107438 [Prauserella marina]|uniref:Uncharacterized protein n=1 Tax=Prauserella marina TaxID=530584 RepID=A0A1G6U3J3_9PSEU|nr:hypothetical protein [Prauserella marina]PWV75387.1 hypothetical protein DES30_1062 [Prauserella marina]SDD35764.1 hypothetical protein SAMN05421630_107438 [Prauserella marina]
MAFRAALSMWSPPGTPTVVTGVSAVAEEASFFADRIRLSRGT